LHDVDKTVSENKRSLVSTAPGKNSW